VDTGLTLDRRPNLVIAWGEEEPGARSIVLNSHIDTVSWEEEAEKWTHPISGSIEDGHVWGRGAVDAKGQLMVALMAMTVLRDLGWTPRGRVVFQSVVDEEPGGNGTLALCEQGWHADAAIVLEPNNNQIAYGHRGIMGLRFSTLGSSGHGGVEGNEGNAVLGLPRLLEIVPHALDDWASPADEIYGPPALNLGHVEGGEDIFTRPASCALDVGVRYAPGTGELLRVKIEQYVQEQWDQRPVEGLRLDAPELCRHYDAAEIDPEVDFVQELQACLREVGEEGSLNTFPGGCDARHFVNRASVPAVVFGPGSLSAAHVPDEHLAIDQWLRAVEALALFLVRWCS
jgi:acetylornithine deacetylase